MWRQYFNIIGIKPGVVVYPRPFGEVDFRSDNLDLDKLRRVFEADHPYIKMTPAGMDHFYGNQVQELRHEHEAYLESAKADNNKPAYTNENGHLLKAKDLVAVIQKAQTEEEARYFYGLGKKYTSVQKAYDKKLQELTANS